MSHSFLSFPLAEFVCVETIEPQEEILWSLPTGWKAATQERCPSHAGHCTGEETLFWSLLRFRVKIKPPYSICFMFLDSYHIYSKLYKCHKLHLSSMLYSVCLSFSLDQWVRYWVKIGTWEWKASENIQDLLRPRLRTDALSFLPLRH